MSQLVTINLSKNPGAPWGFRLQGGKDFAQPLCIQKVNPGSIAEAAGLQTGDAIVRIAATDALALRHKEAQDTILKAGNTFAMQVQRGSTIWKPQVTPVADPQSAVATKTSLAAPGKLAPVKMDETQRAPKGFNAAPVGFTTQDGQTVAPTQYNTPIGLYTEENIASALNAQAEVLGVKDQKQVLGINFKKHDHTNVAQNTELLRMVQEMDSKPAPSSVAPAAAAAIAVPSAYSGTHTPSEMIGTPEVPVQGASFRVLEKLLNDEIDSGGHYNVNDKLYCDSHAKQAAKQNPPAPNMVPITVKPGAPVPAGAVAAPAFMRR